MASRQTVMRQREQPRPPPQCRPTWGSSVRIRVAESCDLTESRDSYREFVPQFHEENAREMQRYPRRSISDLDCEVSFKNANLVNRESSSVDQRIHVRHDHYSQSERIS